MTIFIDKETLSEEELVRELKEEENAREDERV